MWAVHSRLPVQHPLWFFFLLNPYPETLNSAISDDKYHTAQPSLCMLCQTSSLALPISSEKPITAVHHSTPVVGLFPPRLPYTNDVIISLGLSENFLLIPLPATIRVETFQMC